jgi:hypothetical protein
MQSLTIVCDVNPDIDGAMGVLAPYLAVGTVKDARPCVAMGESIECEVMPETRAEVVRALNSEGFRIVEGGQQ